MGLTTAPVTVTLNVADLPDIAAAVDGYRNAKRSYFDFADVIEEAYKSEYTPLIDRRIRGAKTRQEDRLQWMEYHGRILQDYGIEPADIASDIVR
jgi:hypothetical protein